MMELLFRHIAVLMTAALLTSCSLFDSGVEWQSGPYALVWIDTLDSLSVSRDLGGGSWIGRVESTVFAIGWDGRYLVAKQHPHNDRSRTNYFVIDAKKDTDDANPAEVVTGPLTAAEFQRQSSDLHLPEFSRVVTSLQ